MYFGIARRALVRVSAWWPTSLVGSPVAAAMKKTAWRGGEFNAHGQGAGRLKWRSGHKSFWTMFSGTVRWTPGMRSQRGALSSARHGFVHMRFCRSSSAGCSRIPSAFGRSASVLGRRCCGGCAVAGAGGVWGLGFGGEVAWWGDRRGGGMMG